MFWNHLFRLFVHHAVATPTRIPTTPITAPIAFQLTEEPPLLPESCPLDEEVEDVGELCVVWSGVVIDLVVGLVVAICDE